MSDTAPTRKPAAARKAAAARAEKKPAPRTVDFRGLPLTVPPPSEWSSELYFLIGDLEETQFAVSAANSVIRELIGADQFGLVRVKLRDDKVPFGDVETVLLELFDTLMESYGTTSGESEASPDS